jgi:hypothetical protein
VAESETRATIAQALCNAKLTSQPNNYRSGRLTNHPSCGGGEMVERVKQRQQSLLLCCRDKTGTPFSPSGVLTRVHSFTTRQRGQKHQARPSLLQRRLFKESGFIYLSIPKRTTRWTRRPFDTKGCDLLLPLPGRAGFVDRGEERAVCCSAHEGSGRLELLPDSGYGGSLCFVVGQVMGQQRYGKQQSLRGGLPGTCERFD